MLVYVGGRTDQAEQTRGVAAAFTGRLVSGVAGSVIRQISFGLKAAFKFGPVHPHTHAHTYNRISKQPVRLTYFCSLWMDFASVASTQPRISAPVLTDS